MVWIKSPGALPVQYFIDRLSQTVAEALLDIGLLAKLPQNGADALV